MFHYCFVSIVSINKIKYYIDVYLSQTDEPDSEDLSCRLDRKDSMLQEFSY